MPCKKTTPIYKGGNTTDIYTVQLVSMNIIIIMMAYIWGEEFKNITHNTVSIIYHMTLCVSIQDKPTNLKGHKACTWLTLPPQIKPTYPGYYIATNVLLVSMKQGE